MLVTVDDLLKKGLEKKKNNKFKVYIVELDKEIECKTITATEYLDILGSNCTNKAAEIIYNCCDVFKNDILIDKFNCRFNPVEVVENILSYATVYHLSEYILEKSDIDVQNREKYLKEMEDDIKN